MSCIPTVTASEAFPFSGDWCFMECYAEIFLNGKDRYFIVPVLDTLAVLSLLKTFSYQLGLFDLADF